MTPAQAIFNQHILLPSFQEGVDAGMWGIAEDDHTFANWPNVTIWIAAREKPGCPNKYYFRFDLTNYPVSAPTACLWDMKINARLEDKDWPNGGPIVSTVFNPNWNKTALYAPCDRVAMAGHGNWAAEHKDYWWKPIFRIEKYLHFVYSRLQSGDYVRT